MSDRENTPCYVGIKPCGCCVFAQVDPPEKKTDKAYQRMIAKSIARCIDRGMSIERKTVKWVKEHFKECTHKKRPNQTQRELI